MSSVDTNCKVRQMTMPTGVSILLIKIIRYMKKNMYFCNFEIECL